MHEMTDKELIQALRHCASDDEYGCLRCPGEENCDSIAGGAKSLLDAANRLEKLAAENEALKTKLWPEYCQDMAEYSCPRVVQLRQEIDHLREATKIVGEDTNVPTKWVSVSERLPDRDGRYLCNVKSFAFPGRTYISILQYDKYGFREGNIYTDDVTHWMSLPSTEEVE